MSQVIYARVPDSLKESADAYAAERGLTLTSAVVDLLHRGLAAAADAESIVDLEARTARLITEKAASESELQVARTELGTVNLLAQRANQAVGRCPEAACGQPITGYDLLAVGQCPHCGRGLSSLMAPTPSASTLDQRDFMILLGALGALVGVAILTSKGK
jgi:antitoxin component of RelBE/YafQ-DinJ toxin-antitoxin module